MTRGNSNTNLVWHLASLYIVLPYLHHYNYIFSNSWCNSHPGLIVICLPDSDTGP